VKYRKYQQDKSDIIH